jgi:DNA-binding HxlR family transcriptional regulator
MTAGIESLHKILKDQTRRKIVLSINEKGSLSYTELMNTVAVSSTGTLNYHLKVLSELLTKDETGQYMLTEKGKLASKLLLEFPERENQEQVKNKWWRRFWVVAIVLQVAVLAVALSLYFLGYASFPIAVQGIVGFFFAVIFTYFFYRMIRPQRGNVGETPPRTVENIFVAGKNLQQVKRAVHQWIAEEKISIEVERDDFVRGRLGIPSGLGLTAPKYFEVSLKPQQDGVMVHTEGWISLYDVSERSFTKSLFALGNIPRRKGWKVMEHLWTRLKAT